MISLLLKCSPDQKDRLIAELWEAGTAGIQEEGDQLRAFFQEAADLPVQFAAYAPEVREEEARDWERVWQDQWQPVLVGEHFFLVPAWRDDPTPAGRIRLEMHPGQACGTGAHPATQVSLEAMEKRVLPGAAVLDIGTGSGILSEAARLLGAGLVVGCDIDPVAIEGASRVREVQFFRGSVRSVRTASMDLVIANINAIAILDLAPEIKRALKPGGKAILSGFTDRDRDRIAGHFEIEEVLTREGWLAIVAADKRR